MKRIYDKKDIMNAISIYDAILEMSEIGIHLTASNLLELKNKRNVELWNREGKITCEVTGG